MGNSKSEILKEEFRQKKFKTLKKASDRLMGPFEILSFREYPQNFFLKKQIDPQDYDQQAQIDQFVANLSQQNKHIAEFYFVYQTSPKRDIFDLVFEYGNQMKNKFEKEKYIWDLIEQIVEGMIVLEKQNLHYPFINGRFILQEGNNKFKLVNPYCFENYLRDVLHIYLNPMVPINKRKQHCQQQILKNIRELGCLVIILLGNFDEIQIYENPQYRKQCIRQLKTDKTQFYEFLDFIFDSSIYAISFTEMKEWLKKNQVKSKPNFFNIINDIVPGRQHQQPQQKLIQKQTQQQNKQHKIFSEDTVQIRNTQDIGKEIQEMAFKEERQKLLNEQQLRVSKKSSEGSVDEKVIKKVHSDEKLNISNEPRFQSLGYSNVQNKLSGSLVESNIPEDDLDNLDFFNEDSVPQQLKKRHSINDTPIINSQTELDQKNLEGFNFLNNDNHSSKNINNYLKNNTVKKQMEQSLLLDQQNNIDKEFNKDINRQEKVAKFIGKNYQNDSNILIEENKPIKIIQEDQIQEKQNSPSKSQQNQSFLKQSQPNNQIESQQDPHVNNFQPTSIQEKPKVPKNTSQIQKISIRWNKEQQNYFKEVLYKDGSTEVLEMDEKESIKYSQMGKNRNNSVGQQPQQTVNNQQNIKKGLQENLSILLYPQVELQPLLIVKTAIDFTKNEFTAEQEKFVDRSTPLKASNYHKVSQEGIDVQKLSLKCQKMKASMHITRDLYNKR